MVKKTITYEEYLKIEGLLVLRTEVNKQFNYIQAAIANIVEEPEDSEDYYGLVSDHMWETTGAKILLNKLDIKIKPKKKCQKK